MFSRFSLRTKLLAGFGTGTAILIVVGAVAVWGSSTQGAAATKLREAATTATLSERLKFQAADVNGWQTAYAFDVTRGVRGARSDNAPSRKAFLASEGGFDALVKELKATNLDAAERGALDHVAAGGTRFSALDNRIWKLYKQNTPAADTKANELVLGAEIRIYNEVSASITKLVDYETTIEDAAGANARSTQTLITTV